MFSNRRKTKKAPFPLARLSLLKDYHPESKEIPLSPPFQFAIDLIDKLSGLNKKFALIMLETGARPVEILALCSGHSHRNGSILITSAKNSQDRIAHSPTFRTMMPKENVDPTFQPFRYYSYRKFYRAVMKTGMIQTGTKLVHVPISRLFRQAYASIANDLSDGKLDVVAHTLGHKQSKNAEYYIQQKG